jgi:hypothetical protein
MSTELAAPTPMSLMATAIEKGTDAKTLEGFMALQERYEANEAAKRFAVALAGFQAACPTITKTREVKNRDGALMYRFANYEDIILEVRDLLRKWHIVVTFTIDHTEASGQPMGMMRGTCRVRVGTHYEDSTLTVPIPKGMNTNSTQEFGMATSYLKRYLLCAALNIVVAGEDDDARGLIERITQDQIVAINTLIDDCRDAGNPIDVDKFKDWLSARAGCEIQDLSDVPAKVYADAIGMLNRKKAGK